MHVSIYLLITFIVAMSTMLTTLLLYVIPASKGMLTSSTLHARLLACSSVLRLTRCTYSTCLLTLEFCTYSMQKNITSIVYIIMTSPYKLIKFSRHPTALHGVAIVCRYYIIIWGLQAKLYRNCEVFFFFIVYNADVVTWWWWNVTSFVSIYRRWHKIMFSIFMVTLEWVL